MKSAIERLHKLLRLQPGERVVLGQAWGLLVVVELALRFLPFKQLLALCRRRPPRGRADSGTPLPVPRLVWLVEVASRYAPVNATCLKKSLVLSWLLGRRGIEAELRIGVARENGGLRAHAWLVHNGQAILGHQAIAEHVPLLPER